MEKLSDTVDVVIKIKKLDDYRTRPQKSEYSKSTRQALDQSSELTDVLSENKAFKAKVILIIQQNPLGIKAKKIAEALGVDKSKINSLLYFLKREGVCTIDEFYNWTLVKTKDELTPSKPIQASIAHKCVESKDIENYIYNFEHLSVAIRNGSRAPHKYVLLIAVFNLINKGLLTSNRFSPSIIIDDEFKNIWTTIVKADTSFKPNPVYPYWHMISEPFWNLLHLNDGSYISAQRERPILAAAKQRKELIIELDHELFTLAKDNLKYKELILALLRCYNAPTMISTDKAMESFRDGKTTFEIGTCLFNGCMITVTDCTKPCQYVTKTGIPATKSARYWGEIQFPDGHKESFKKKRGGEIARETGFYVEDEQDKYELEGDAYLLPYLRK